MQGKVVQNFQSKTVALQAEFYITVIHDRDHLTVNLTVLLTKDWLKTFCVQYQSKVWTHLTIHLNEKVHPNFCLELYLKDNFDSVLNTVTHTVIF